MYNDLIPTDLQDELIIIRDQDSSNSWRVADIVSEVIQFNVQNEHEFVMQDIYAAVAMFAGRSSRTVREYHHIGKFFAPELREQFGVLAFDHFRHAARLGEQAIDALQWCIEQVDTLNRPATVDAMEAHFLLPDPPMPEPPPIEENNDFILIQIQNTVNNVTKSLQTLAASSTWTTMPFKLHRAMIDANDALITLAKAAEEARAEMNTGGN